MLLELYERKEKRALVSALSLLYLSGWKCNNYGAVVPHAGGIPWVLIGRTQGTKVNTHQRTQQSVSDLLGPSARLTRGSSAALHAAICKGDVMNSATCSSAL